MASPAGSSHTGTDWVAVGLAVYGAALSSLLAWRQFWHDRRRLRVIARTLVALVDGGGGEYVALELLEVRALNEGRRPIYVTQAGVLTNDGGYFHPRRVEPYPDRANTAPALLHDGEGATFYFDLLSFEGGWEPRAVWVQDQGDRRYVKRLSRKNRRGIAEMVVKLRKRVGDIDSQQDLLQSDSTAK